MDFLAPFIFGTFAVVGLVVFVGVPVAFSLGLAGLVGLCIFFGPVEAIQILSVQAYSSTYSYALVAVPLYILMAEVLVAGKSNVIAFEAFGKLTAGIQGSLALATVGFGTVIAACSGSSAGNTAVLSRLALPQMLERGYSRRLAVGSVVGAGGLAVIIPPSLTMILYSYVMELPLLPLFAAGVFPGLIMATGYATYVLGYGLINPKGAPSTRVSSWRERIKAFFVLQPFVLIVLVVLGSLFLGLASVVESAALGVLSALCVGPLFRYLGFPSGTAKEYIDALRQTAKTTGFIMLIIVGASVFSFFWSITGVTSGLGGWLERLPLSPFGLLLVMNLMLLFLGCLMDTISLILVVLPIFVYALMKFGMDPIWLGIIFLINMEMALTTPPIGMNLFVAMPEAERHGIQFHDIVMGGLPFLMADAIAILITIAFPGVALWLAKIVG